MAKLILADAIVIDTAKTVDDLVDSNGVLASLLAHIERSRDAIVLNPDPAGTLKALFKFKISKKKEEDIEEEVIKEDQSELSEESEESEEEEDLEEVIEEEDD